MKCFIWYIKITSCVPEWCPLNFFQYFLIIYDSMTLMSLGFCLYSNRLNSFLLIEISWEKHEKASKFINPVHYNSGIHFRSLSMGTKKTVMLFWNYYDDLIHLAFHPIWWPQHEISLTSIVKYFTRKHNFTS